VTDSPPTRSPSEPDIDTGVAHAARIYDYMLGGTTNFEADREASHAAATLVPGGFEAVSAGLKANRGFITRAVRYLTAECGIRQFLDVGAGIPTYDNVHEIAQEIAPDTKVVYVDYDPIVLAHAHKLLQSSDQGKTGYLEEDLRDPDKVLAGAAKTLDFGQPVAVVLAAILHFFPDSENPQRVVDRLLAAVPPGSYLVLSHLARDIYDLDATYERLNAATRETFVLRTRDQVAGFLHGVEIVEPGVVLVHEWRPDPGEAPYEDMMLPLYGAVGRKA
jgi:acetone carboxylase gamma subunit